jgi:hypothetical protein
MWDLLTHVEGQFIMSSGIIGVLNPSMGRGAMLDRRQFVQMLGVGGMGVALTDVKIPLIKDVSKDLTQRHHVIAPGLTTQLGITDGVVSRIKDVNGASSSFIAMHRDYLERHIISTSSMEFNGNLLRSSHDNEDLHAFLYHGMVEIRANFARDALELLQTTKREHHVKNLGVLTIVDLPISLAKEGRYGVRVVCKYRQTIIDEDEDNRILESAVYSMHGKFPVNVRQINPELMQLADEIYLSGVELTGDSLMKFRYS